MVSSPMRSMSGACLRHVCSPGHDRSHVRNPQWRRSCGVVRRSTCGRYQIASGFVGKPYRHLPKLRLETELQAPPEVCFDLSRSIELHIESMGRSKERAVAGVASGLIGPDEEVTWEARHLGRNWRVTSRIIAFDRPNCFVDEMTDPGPFSYFRHRHLFQAVDNGTLMVDEVEFKVRAALGGSVAGPFARWYLRRLLTARNEVLRKNANS